MNKIQQKLVSWPLFQYNSGTVVAVYQRNCLFSTNSEQ